MLIPNTSAQEGRRVETHHMKSQHEEKVTSYMQKILCVGRNFSSAFVTNYILAMFLLTSCLYGNIKVFCKCINQLLFLQRLDTIIKYYSYHIPLARLSVHKYQKMLSGNLFENIHWSLIAIEYRRKPNGTRCVLLTLSSSPIHKIIKITH